MMDSELEAAVRIALHRDLPFLDHRVFSTVANGIVTLEGDADTYAQREAAERAVRNIPGVDVVLDDIAIAAGEVTPDALRAAIHEALERHAGRDAHHVKLDIEGGRVTLHGTVHSWREREAIVGAVTSTRGVDSVIDRLRLA